MIPLFKTFIAPDAAARVAETMATLYVGQGPRVDEFEQALVPWIGDCVTVNSGTSALTLAYDLAGVRAGDKVITTPITCLATNAPLAHAQAEVLWADCDPRTGLIDAESVRRLLEKHRRVKAIVAVDYGGMLPDLSTLRGLADMYGARLIEDCAHSFGAYGHGLAHLETYSFQAIKALTTGDGGALVTGDAALAEAKLKRWFGLDRAQGGFRCEQVVRHAGYKMHMNDIAASIGLANLPHVEANITRARRNAASYDAARLGHVSQSSACWLYTICVNERERFISHMQSRGIQCARVHSSNKVHPIFNAPHVDTLGADEFDARQVSIPVGWWLSDVDVQHIIQAVHEFSAKAVTA